MSTAFEINDIEKQDTGSLSRFGVPERSDVIERANQSFEKLGDKVTDDALYVMEAFVLIENRGLKIQVINPKYQEKYEKFLEITSSIDFIANLNNSISQYIEDLKKGGDTRNQAGYNLFLAVSVLKALSVNQKIFSSQNDKTGNRYEVIKCLKLINNIKYNDIPQEEFPKKSWNIFNNKKKLNTSSSNLIGSIASVKGIALALAFEEITEPENLYVFINIHVAQQFAGNQYLDRLKWGISDISTHPNQMNNNEKKRSILNALISLYDVEEATSKNPHHLTELASCIDSFQYQKFIPETEDDDYLIRSMNEIATSLQD